MKNSSTGPDRSKYCRRCGKEGHFVATCGAGEVDTEASKRTPGIEASS